MNTNFPVVFAVLAYLIFFPEIPPKLQERFEVTQKSIKTTVYRFLEIVFLAPGL